MLEFLWLFFDFSVFHAKHLEIQACDSCFDCSICCEMQMSMLQCASNSNEKRNKFMQFAKGVKNALPIAMGYIPVAFAFGVLGVEKGFSPWFPILISITNFTGTGQFAGLELIASLATFIELFSTMFIINVRYSLMSLSLSQRLSSNTKWWQRIIIAFGVTDENYAVAIMQKGSIDFKFFLGVMSTSYLGWIFGTVLGACLGNVFTPTLMSAFGIALYAMFVAIILPPATQNKSIFFLILISIAFSCLFYFTPTLKNLSNGWVIIIGSIICSAIASLIFPKKLNEDGTLADKPNKIQKKIISIKKIDSDNDKKIKKCKIDEKKEKSKK